MKIVSIDAPARWKSLEFMPEASLLEITGVDPDKVVADMEKNGYDKNRPIIIFDGTGADGRLRHSCAIKAKVQPTFARFDGTKEELLGYIFRERILRQNLNEGQRALFASKYAAELMKLVPEANGKSIDEKAQMAGVSPRTQDFSDKVEEHGSPKLQDAVAAGDVRVSDAARIAKEPKAVQDAAVKAVKNEEAVTVDEAVRLMCKRCRRTGGKPIPGCKDCAANREKARRKALKKKAKALSSGKLDDFHNELPAGRVDAFKDPFIQEAINLLETVSEKFRTARLADGMLKRQKHYPFIKAKGFADGVGQVIGELDKLIGHLKENRPAGVCPACEGKGCSKCKRAGLLPVEEYKQVKKALKDK
jgi:hypothetical protein